MLHLTITKIGTSSFLFTLTLICKRYCCRNCIWYRYGQTSWNVVCMWWRYRLSKFHFWNIRVLHWIKSMLQWIENMTNICYVEWNAFNNALKILQIRITYATSCSLILLIKCLKIKAINRLASFYFERFEISSSESTKLFGQ